MAHKTLDLLLKREKYGLTRLLASCPQLRERSKEKNMGLKGSWPLAHSSESTQDMLYTSNHDTFWRETLKYDTFVEKTNLDSAL